MESKITLINGKKYYANDTIRNDDVVHEMIAEGYISAEDVLLAIVSYHGTQIMSGKFLEFLSRLEYDGVDRAIENNYGPSARAY